MTTPTPPESFLSIQERDGVLKTIRAPVESRLDDVQAEINAFVDAPSRLLADLAKHVIAIPGKKFRPTLLLLVAGLGGRINGSAVRGGAMVEMIHTATLIHDDSIDRSLTRRGLPTINALWNDKVSVILGDYLYTRAFNDLVERGEWPSVQVLSRCAHRMSLGIMLEIEQKGDLEIDEEQYGLLIAEKTASLISAACEIGAAVSFAGDEERERFRAFGHDLGMAYQIADDLFDYIGDEEALGKDIGCDLKEGKITLPIVRALQNAPDDIFAIISSTVREREISREAWERLTAHLEEIGAFRYCRELADSYAARAREHLEGYPSSVYRDALERAVDFAIDRSH